MTGLQNFKERHSSFVEKGLRELCGEIVDSLGRKPMVVELVEVVAHAARTSAEGTFSDPPTETLERFELKFRAGSRSALSPEEIESARKSLGEFSDAAFVAASDLVRDLSRMIGTEMGRALSMMELGALLLEGLRRCGEDLAAGVRPGDILSIKPKTKKKIVSTVGDLVAIPAQDERFFIASVLTKNRFGTAYGFFRGARDARPFSPANHPEPHPFPIYSGERGIAQGRWKIIGHDKELLRLFPAEPEVYHSKSSVLNADDSKIGPYGAAENGKGELRSVSEEEASRVGLLSDEYRQTYTEDFLETRLPALLKS
jgi:hypothetical protein